MNDPVEWKLLPDNSTDFEQALEIAVRPHASTDAAIEQLTTLENNPPDSFLPFLAWERGLLPLLPYLKNIRTAIEQGQRWQNERGTELAIRRALNWIDITLEKYTEEGAGYHWREIQLGVNRIPSPDEIIAIKALVSLSARAVTVLKRVHNHYNIPHFTLDNNNQMDHHLLDNYSGVYKKGIWQSFAQTQHKNVSVDHTLSSRITTRARSNQVDAQPQNLRLGNCGIFGITPKISSLSSRGRRKSRQTQASAAIEGCQRKIISYSSIVLDERSHLDDINALLNPIYKPSIYLFILDETLLGDYKNDHYQPLHKVYEQRKSQQVNSHIKPSITKTQQRISIKRVDDPVDASYQLDQGAVMTPAQSLHRVKKSQRATYGAAPFSAFWIKTWSNHQEDIVSRKRTKSQIVNATATIAVSSANHRRVMRVSDTRIHAAISQFKHCQKSSQQNNTVTHYPAYWRDISHWNAPNVGVI